MNLSEEELEKKVNRLSTLSRRLGIFIPIARYKIVSILDGEVLDTREGISRSWNRNAYNWIASCMTFSYSVATTFGDGYLSFKSTAGTVLGAGAIFQVSSSSSNASNELQNGYAVGVNIDTTGIVVGTGVGPEIFNDYVLGTKILSGITAGTLSYQESYSPTKTWNAGQYDVVWSRYFNNNTVSNIVVGEAGIYGKLYSGVVYMVCRDLVDPVVTVADGGQLYVEYTISLIYP